MFLEDCVERVDVRIDEHPAVDLQRWFGSEVHGVRPGVRLLNELVLDVKLIEKSCNQSRLLLLGSGEKPYGHPPLPSTRAVSIHLDSSTGNGRRAFPRSQIIKRQ